MPWAPCNGTTSTPPKLVVMLAPNDSTLQWHPAMAPRPLPQSWPSPSTPTIAHYNGTLQWHPAMAPRPLPQSSPPTIAHYNGTQQWHHVHSPKVGRQPPPPPTLQWQCAMAPSNATSTAPCNGTLVPRPISQSGSSPSPPIGSKNPYSYRYLGKNTTFWGGAICSNGFQALKGCLSIEIKDFLLSSVQPPFWGSILQRWTSQYVLKWMMTATTRDGQLSLR